MTPGWTMLIRILGQLLERYILMEKDSLTASAADLVDHRLAACIIEIGDYHSRALTNECHGAGSPDRGGAACYDCNLSIYLAMRSSRPFPAERSIPLSSQPSDKVTTPRSDALLMPTVAITAPPITAFSR